MDEGFEIVLWALLIVASVTDLLWGKIFNAITLPCLIGGVVCRLWLGGLSSMSIGAFGVLVAFLAFFPLYILKTWAAADVKLLMAVGAWSNSKLVLQLGFISIFVGALVGGFLLLKQKGLKQSADSIKAHLLNRATRSMRIPFAPAFLCAFFLIKIGELKGWNLF